MAGTLTKIISGGQTGADQGALDAAIACGLAYGGAVPAGRLTEAGPLPPQYSMEELSGKSYPARTAKNVRDSDGTLIVSHGELSGGSALTRKFTERYGRPYLHLDLEHYDIAAAAPIVSDWLIKNQIRTLNVAGPRASSDPRIYNCTYQLVTALVLRDQGVSCDVP